MPADPFVTTTTEYANVTGLRFGDGTEKDVHAAADVLDRDGAAAGADLR